MSYTIKLKGVHDMFKIQKGYDSESKTFRLPLELIEQLNVLATRNKLSLDVPINFFSDAPRCFFIQSDGIHCQTPPPFLQNKKPKTT